MLKTASLTASTRGDEAMCFQSTAHPQGASAALAYSRAMARPLGATLIPLMLFALAAALTGHRIWPHFFWASAGALVVAWGWARFQLARTPAEVRVRPDQQNAALRSVRDVLRAAPPDWRPALRLRVEHTALRLDLGDTSHRLLTSRWPQAEALQEALRRAVPPS